MRVPGVNEPRPRISWRPPPISDQLHRFFPAQKPRKPGHDVKYGPRRMSHTFLCIIVSIRMVTPDGDGTDRLADDRQASGAWRALGICRRLRSQKGPQNSSRCGGGALFGPGRVEHYEFISVDWTKIEAAYSQALNPPGGLDAVVRGWVDSLAAVLPGAGGFAVGFFWGMRKG